jgi:lysophospholipase L1-like esterase
MRIDARSRVLFIGDSITDCGRARPVGEAAHDRLGTGYVNQVNALLFSTYPERPMRVLNTGTSGDTVVKLTARWQTDVLDLKPDWLSIMIGTNDVWRQFDRPLHVEDAVQPDVFERTYDDLLTRTRPLLKGLVLMTPFFIEPLAGDPMRARMDAYGAIVRRLATRHGAAFVDVQAAFDRHLRHNHSSTLAWDRIHPTPAGHMIIARAFLDAVGFDWAHQPA